MFLSLARERCLASFASARIAASELEWLLSSSLVGCKWSESGRFGISSIGCSAQASEMPSSKSGTINTEARLMGRMPLTGC